MLLVGGNFNSIGGDSLQSLAAFDGTNWSEVYSSQSLLKVFFQGVDTTDDDTLHRIDMTFDASSADKKLIPLDKETYWNNYYLGHIPEGRPFVSLYGRMYMQDVWPNIDVVYSSNQRGLKYYLVVNSGGETGAIALKYHGYEDLYVDGNDALVIESEIGEVVQPQALAYEMDGSGELSLLGWQPEYDVNSGVVTFDGIGSWSGDLVIEVNWGYANAAAGGSSPGWCTFYGGLANEFSYDNDVDPSGNSYYCGETKSADFPEQGVSNNGFNGVIDAFVGKIDIDYKVQWMAYYGGELADRAFGVAHDAFNDELYLCGETGQGIPSGSWTRLSSQQYGNGYSDSYGQRTGFLARFDALYGLRNWGTSFGGGSDARCIDIETDSDGNLFVIGWNVAGTLSSSSLCQCSTSTSGTFPICHSSNGEYLQEMHQGGATMGSDAFVAKFSHSTDLLWSTLFGGEGDDYLYDLAIDDVANKFYFVGSTASPYTSHSGCPGLGPVDGVMPFCGAGGYNQYALNGTSNSSTNDDGLIGRFTTNGVIEWNVYYGGSGVDRITGIALVPNAMSTSFDAMVITGSTSTSTYGSTNCYVSTNQGFPSCDNGQYHDIYRGGGNDIFISMLDVATNLTWSSFYGGSGNDDVSFDGGQQALNFIGGPKVAVNSDGEKYIFGDTESGSASTNAIPVGSDPFLYFEAGHRDYNLAQNPDAFILRFDANNDLDYASYFGGKGADFAGSISLFGDRVYVSGGTFSDPIVHNFPLREYDQNSSFDCYRDYSTLPGSVGLTISDAFFAQLRSDNNSVSVAPIEDETKSGVLVFPNPTNSQLTIRWETEKPEIVCYSLDNILGVRVIEGEWHATVGVNEVELKLSNYPTGIYLLTFASNKRKEVRKICVTR